MSLHLDEPPRELKLFSPIFAPRTGSISWHVPWWSSSLSTMPMSICSVRWPCHSKWPRWGRSFKIIRSKSSVSTIISVVTVCWSTFSSWSSSSSPSTPSLMKSTCSSNRNESTSSSGTPFPSSPLCSVSRRSSCTERRRRWHDWRFDRWEKPKWVSEDHCEEQRENRLCGSLRWFRQLQCSGQFRWSLFVHRRFDYLLHHAEILETTSIQSTPGHAVQIASLCSRWSEFLRIRLSYLYGCLRPNGFHDLWSRAFSS